MKKKGYVALMYYSELNSIHKTPLLLNMRKAGASLYTQGSKISEDYENVNLIY